MGTKPNRTAAYKYRKRKFFAPAYQHGTLRKNKTGEYFQVGDKGLLEEDGRLSVVEIETEEQKRQADAVWAKIRKRAKEAFNNEVFSSKDYTEPTLKKLDAALKSGGRVNRNVYKKTGIKIE